MSSLLSVAIEAAHAAGKLQRENFGTDLAVNEMLRHDIKLDLDVRSQELITGIILSHFPDHAVLGEEGDAGNPDSTVQWIVDPIDGTVNYFYGIPHFCVSIGVRDRGELVAGVIYDPMQDETWAVEKGGVATLNGKTIRTSPRTQVADAVVTVGFSKSQEALITSFERYKRISLDVRKTRMLGSAALALAYIACGRLDAYIEEQISDWDVAAGRLILEAAGGTFMEQPSRTHEGKIFVCATNGKVDMSSYL
jgi:myo-inositol-1(or 4)-monophosphatase